MSSEEIKPNIPLLTNTLVHIAVNPTDWNQGSWRCGTGMCYAGHAVSLHGMQWVDSADGMYQDYVFDDDGNYVFDVQDKKLSNFMGKGVKQRLQEWIDDPSFPDTFSLGRIARIADDAREQANKIEASPERYRRCSTAGEAAQKILGLTGSQASDLFAAGNGLADLTRVVSDIIAEQ